MEQFKEYMDERLIKPDENCGECNVNLQMEIDDILYYSKTSNNWLCYDCYTNLLMDEDIIFFQYRADGMAEMIRTRPLPAGPGLVKKPSLDISTIFDSYSKCEHIAKHFDDLRLVFHCEDCGKWLCSSCLDEHKRHSITGFARFDKSEKGIQVLPYKYESIVKADDLKVDYTIPKKIYLDKKFPINLKIENLGSETVYDLQIDFGLHSTIIDPSTEYDYYETSKIKRVEFIKPKSIEKN